MDYVLVTYLAARASALSYAVGEWARIWPLSRLIKSMGAYFIRRKSRGQLYRKVLARYVQMATAAGSTQAIFPEGGLSLDGRLMPPKLGILAYVVAAWEREGRDVAFVPVAIGYDRVLEDRVLIAAHERGDRRFGAKISVVMGFIFKMLWLKITGRFQKFGRAEVVFGAPVVLSKIADPHDVTKLAETLMLEISNHIPLLPVPAIAAALNDGPLGLEALKAKVADAGIDTESTLQALDILEQRGLILRCSDRFEANPKELGLVQFYSNAASAKL
jgi:glycerol-3-phosphate O-acyltransferase